MGPIIPMTANNDGGEMNTITQVAAGFSCGDSGCSSIFLPEHFEPDYAYPLLAYLHEDGTSDLALSDWFPQISERNYLGLGIRAPFPTTLGMPGQYRWLVHRPDASIGKVRESLEDAVRMLNIHPERIYLFGEGVGAIVALQVLLLQQAGFCEELSRVAGVICRGIPPLWARCLPPILGPLDSRLLLLDDVKTAMEDAVIESMREAGLDVSIDGSPQSGQGRAIDHWIMSCIGSTVM